MLCKSYTLSKNIKIYYSFSNLCKTNPDEHTHEYIAFVQTHIQHDL